MIAFRVRDAKGARTQRARCFRKGGRGREGRTGNLEQNLRSWRQRAANSHKGAPGAHIERGGKLKELLSLFIAATYENGDRQGQPRPLPTFLLGFAPNQEVP